MKNYFKENTSYKLVFKNFKHLKFLCQKLIKKMRDGADATCNIGLCRAEATGNAIVDLLFANGYYDRFFYNRIKGDCECIFTGVLKKSLKKHENNDILIKKSSNFNQNI